MLGTDGAFAEIGMVAVGTTAPTAETVWRVNGDEYNWRNPDGIEFTRKITTDGYIISVADTVHNASDSEITVAPYGRIVRANDMASSAGVYSGSVAFVNSDLEHEDWARLADNKSFAYTTSGGFVGFVDQYWETILGMGSVLQNRLAIIPKKNMVEDLGLTVNSTHAVANKHLLPKYAQKMFYMKSYDITFPIKHPEYVIADMDYYSQILRNSGIGRPFIRFMRKVEYGLRCMWYGEFNRILKFKNKQ